MIYASYGIPRLWNTSCRTVDLNVDMPTSIWYWRTHLWISRRCTAKRWSLWRPGLERPGSATWVICAMGADDGLRVKSDVRLCCRQGRFVPLPAIFVSQRFTRSACCSGLCHMCRYVETIETYWKEQVLEIHCTWGFVVDYGDYGWLWWLWWLWKWSLWIRQPLVVLWRSAEWPVQAARDSAFAAILAGSVVTWGDPDCGGDSSIQEQLRRFQEFFFFLFWEISVGTGRWALLAANKSARYFEGATWRSLRKQKKIKMKKTCGPLGMAWKGWVWESGLD